MFVSQSYLSDLVVNVSRLVALHFITSSYRMDNRGLFITLVC